MATELITNGSFETGTGLSPTGWTGAGPARVDRTAGLAGDGTGYYAFGTDGAIQGGSVQQTIATEAGKTYTISFKAGISWQQANGTFNAAMKVDVLNGATVIESTNLNLSGNRAIGWGTYTLTFTATGPLTTLNFANTSPNGQANFDVGLDKVSVQEALPLNQTGEWGDLKPWPIMGLHSVVLPDGKVLTYGAQSNSSPFNVPTQAAAMFHDIYDPVTGEHTTIHHHGEQTVTDIFCSAAILIPGTDKVLITGGDTRPLGGLNTGVKDTNIFDQSEHSITRSPDGDMAFARWYATTISLPSGQILVLGGSNQSGQGIGTPELYTPGEGWRTLQGASDAGIASGWSYPRAWVGSSGEVIYFAAGGATKVMAIDPSGDGSVRQIGTLPFSSDGVSPSIMYENGKVLIMAANGDLWTMDITGATPVFAKVATQIQDRDYSNMTVLADGTVLINGGSNTGNSEPGAEKTAAIWNPDTGRLTYTVDELNPRLYHSTSVLLADGTVLSTAGGFASSSQRNYLDAQIYKPPYLFDETGALADRPVIVGAPKTIEPGDTFTITVDDAASITKLTFAKTGASTHTLNMDARFTDLEFTRGPNNTIIVKVPESVNEVTAGSWMLFAWNDKGVPSVAVMVAVQPTLPVYDGIGDVTAEYFAIPATAMTLDQVDINAPAIHSERVTTISENANGTYFPGGPADDFGVSFSGDFTVDKAGNYTFYLTADDGARLMIDGQLVTQTVGTLSPQNLTQTIPLTAGEHKIQLVYIETGGPGQIDLDWSGPGFGRTNMTFDGADHNLVVNGSFEHNDPTGSVPFGWTKTGAGQVEQIASGAASGRGYFSLGGSSPNHDGTLEQTIDTVEGQTYTLTFSSGVSWQANAGPFVGMIGAEVLNGAVSISSQTFQIGANTAKGYNDYTITFTATGPKTTIKFTDKSPAGQADFDLGVDNVVVKPADGSNNSPPVAPTPPVDPNNMAVNGSFEVGAGTMTMPMAHVMGNGDVPGWSSTANRIEVWMNGHNGVTGTDGKNVVEVDAQNGVLSQTIATEAGKAYGITFDYAGQAGFIGSSKMEVLWNGVVIATINPADAAFKNYHTHAFGTGGNDVLAFRAVAGDTDAIGGLLDKVIVAPSDHPVTPPVTPSAELIANGNFERSGDAAGFGTRPTGWTGTGDGGLDTDPGYAPDGLGYYALGGWSNAVGSTLEQTITTVAGQTYTLTFTSGLAYLDGAIPAGAKLQIDALNGATVLQTKTLSFDPVVGFATYSITFVATGPSSTIRFKDASAAGQGNFDIGIDNVSVKAGGTVTPPPVSAQLIANGDFVRSGDAAGLGTEPAGWTATGDGGLDTDPGYAPDGRATMLWAVGPMRSAARWNKRWRRLPDRPTR